MQIEDMNELKDLNNAEFKKEPVHRNKEDWFYDGTAESIRSRYQVLDIIDIKNWEYMKKERAPALVAKLLTVYKKKHRGNATDRCSKATVTAITEYGMASIAGQFYGLNEFNENWELADTEEQ